MGPAIKGKPLALGVVVGGLAILCVTAFVFRRPLLREWRLRQRIETLESGTTEERIVAIRWFEKEGDVRIAGRLLSAVSRLNSLDEADAGDSDVSEAITAFLQSLRGIILREKEKMVPLLVATLEEKPARPDQMNQVRIGATNWLKLLGPAARDAIPALTEKLDDPDERFRGYVREALEVLEAILARLRERERATLSAESRPRGRSRPRAPGEP